jgi:serine protease Do
MKARLILLALGLVLASQVRAEMLADELTALAAKVRASVMFMLSADDAGRPVSIGTGFIISEDGKLVTNHHVSNAGPRLAARAPGGRQYRVLGVLAEDKEQDLVILEIENNRQPPLLLGGSQDLPLGTPVFMIGNPFGLESTVQQGTVAGFRKFSGARPWIEITGNVAVNGEGFHQRMVHGNGLQLVTDVAAGSSGSPVLDSSGKVLGVISVIGRTKQPTAFAIPVEAVKDLLARANSSH